jgi:hypothetical protein
MEVKPGAEAAPGFSISKLSAPRVPQFGGEADITTSDAHHKLSSRTTTHAATVAKETVVSNA